MFGVVDTLKNGAILILSIVVVILLIDNSCRPSDIIKDELSKPEVISDKTEINSFTIETSYIDTIEYTYWDTVKTSKVPLLNIDLDTNRMDLSDTSVFHDTYYYGKKDSSLEYTIEVYSPCNPDSVKMNYNLKKDITLITDSTYRKDSIHEKQTLKVRVNQLYVGPEAIVYPGFKGGFLTVDFISKRGWQAEAGAGIINSEPGVKAGFKWLVSFRKKK